MEETFILLQKLLSSTTGISLSKVPRSKAALLDYLQTSTNHIFDKALSRKDALWQQLLQFSAREDTLYEYLALGGITFLIYADRVSDVLYFFGPVLTQPFSQEDFLHSSHSHAIPQQLSELILQFCSNLPVVESHVLYRTGDLVVGQLTGRTVPFKISQANTLSSVDEYPLHESYPTGEDIVQMRQVEMRYEYSAALTDAVKQGNLSLALHIIGQYSPTQNTAIRNTNPLRNAQNYCIVLNTQLRHALEESGIHPYRVDKLSNEIGLEIEQLKSISQIHRFFKQVIRRYCRLVQEHDYPHLKPLVNLTVTYIKEHLTDNLTVKDTAKALTVNANYLSSLFHKEMGMTFIDFVNKERTLQAAALLKHTTLQIQQIASIVGYNNTSYFAKQFLRFQGLSPSQYRHN